MRSFGSSGARVHRLGLVARGARRLVSWGLVGLAVSACGDGREGARDAALVQAALDGVAANEVDGKGFLGVAISAPLADGRVFHADAGRSAPDGPAYDGATTEQVIGSVTKLYTAVLVMQLVEAGDVALDDTLDRWFDFAGAERLTVRMLLDHTDGLMEFQEDMTLDDVGAAWTPDALLARALSMAPYGAPPLAEAIYSNTPFLLLAMIVEAETGTAWEANVAARIAAPLGLTHTYYAGEGDKADALAGGWMSTAGGWVDTLSFLDPSVGWGVGAIVTTNEELLRFTSALFDGELFAEPATLDAMLRFDVVMDPDHLGVEPPQRVGLAVIRMELEGVRLDGHLGHIAGFNAAAVRDADTGALIVVTSNDDRAYSGYTAFDVAKALRELRD